VIGAVAVVYNVPGVTTPLQLDGNVLSEIFLGKVRKWNDGKITKLNPGVSLPSRDILVVHRSDGSGTTYIFTDFLSSVNKEWLSGPGRAKEVAWPIGLGGKGNDGVAGQVKQIPGAIGYVELAYARQNKLAFASIKNAAGAFIAPSVESATAAADGVAAKLNPKTTTDLDRERAGPAGVSDHVIHVADRVSGPDRPDQGQEAGRLHAVGPNEWPGVRRGARLCAAPEGHRRSTSPASRLDSDGGRGRDSVTRHKREVQCDVAVTRCSLLRVRFSNNVQ
jgi:phosphate ABC transporter phosphate-binding protein